MNTGNVGIGTTTPTASLHDANDGGEEAIRVVSPETPLVAHRNSTTGSSSAAAAVCDSVDAYATGLWGVITSTSPGPGSAAVRGANLGTNDADCDGGVTCTIGLCVDGVCEYVDAPDGTACDDGDVCTSGDVCRVGICTGTPIPGCGACIDDADCDDGDACTLDACAEGVCQHVIINSDECQGASQDRAIPTISEWGLVIMALLALVVGTIMFREACHRSVTARPSR